LAAQVVVANLLATQPSLVSLMTAHCARVTLLAAQSSQVSPTAAHCAKVPLLVAQLKLLPLMTVHCAMATLLVVPAGLAYARRNAHDPQDDNGFIRPTAKNSFFLTNDPQPKYHHRLR
jgi:hypothetical protein